MEDWLSQLEMAWNDEAMLSNNEYQGIDTLGEELAAVLGEDFSFLPDTTSISSPLNYCTSGNPTNLLSVDQPIIHDDDQQLVIPQLQDHHVPSHNQNVDVFSRDSSSKSITKSSQHVQVQDQNPKITNGSRKDAITTTNNNNNTIDEQVTKGGRKRRRDPEQVHCHIIAERKRRELLTQRFIALSAMVPGLKKVDKTSILEEAIKHLGEMKDKVKVLEEAATSKQNMGSVMVVKTTHLVLDDNDNVSESSAVSSVDDTTYENSDGHKRCELPEIEAKISRKTLLLKICCVNRKGILARIYLEVERFQMIILNSTAVTFEDSGLDVTILAEMEAAQGYDEQVKDLVRALHSVLRIS